MSLKSQEQLEVTSVTRDFECTLYLQHLFDHLYLLSMQLLLDQDEQKKYENGVRISIERIGVDERFVDQPPVSVGSPPSRYLMWHIKNDID